MKSTLEGKRAGFNRNLSRHGHETEEDSVAFRERSAQVESLAACFHELDGTKAVGIDGITKAQYARCTDRIKRREGFCPEPIARIGHDGF